MGVTIAFLLYRLTFHNKLRGWLYLVIFLLLLGLIHLGFLFFLMTCDNRLSCFKELGNL